MVYNILMGRGSRKNKNLNTKEVLFSGSMISKAALKKELDAEEEKFIANFIANEEPTRIIDGVKEWLSPKGDFHRDLDLPARVAEDGSFSEWYQNGLLHRDGDKPARISKNGDLEEWYQHGKAHRGGDRPALVDYRNNKEMYFEHGELHREDGPAVKTPTRELWYCCGELHRDGDLPAQIINKFGEIINKYYENDQLHRSEDLPAVISSTGKVEYYVRSRHLRSDVWSETKALKNLYI